MQIQTASIIVYEEDDDEDNDDDDDDSSSSMLFKIRMAVVAVFEAPPLVSSSLSFSMTTVDDDADPFGFTMEKETAPAFWDNLSVIFMAMTFIG